MTSTFNPHQPLPLTSGLPYDFQHSMPSPPLSSSSRGVHFAQQPVSGVTRPLITAEHNSLRNLERHCQECIQCKQPYSGYKSGRYMCSFGRSLAYDSDHLVLYKDKNIYARRKDANGRDRLEHGNQLNNAVQTLKLIKKYGYEALQPPQAVRTSRRGPSYHQPQARTLPYRYIPSTAATLGGYDVRDFSPGGSSGYSYSIEPSRQPRSLDGARHSRRRSDSVMATVGERYADPYANTSDFVPGRRR